MNEPVWLSGCKEVPAFNVEIFFLLHDELYFGPDNGEDLLDKRLYKRLELPDLPRRLPKWIATKEAVGHERDMAAYYLNTALLRESVGVATKAVDVRMSV